MAALTDDAIAHMNEQYRRAVEPSDLHQEAFETVLRTGGLPTEMRNELVDRLYDPFPDRYKELGGDGGERNDLETNVQRRENKVYLNVSKDLWEMQPIGVLLRPINDEVCRAGEAIVTKVDPYSADVEPDVMPLYHYKLWMEPTPIWLAKFVGGGGYDTLE